MREIARKVKKKNRIRLNKKMKKVKWKIKKNKENKKLRENKGKKKRGRNREGYRLKKIIRKRIIKRGNRRK